MPNKPVLQPETLKSRTAIVAGLAALVSAILGVCGIADPGGSIAGAVAGLLFILLRDGISKGNTARNVDKEG